jgi:hypothetical protein
MEVAYSKGEHLASQRLLENSRGLASPPPISHRGIPWVAHLQAQANVVVAYL